MAKKISRKKNVPDQLEAALRSGPPPKRSTQKSEGQGEDGRRSKGTAKAGPQRLQRILASAGFGSRRHCEELITDGRVEIEGVDVVELGTQVDPATAKIFVDGNLLRKQRLVYFLLNKPPGVVTTNNDPQGRTRVIDLVDVPERIFPVGRLDRSSEGLLLLTNDGDLAQQLAHPKYGVRKIYRVTVAGKVDSDKLITMRKGIYIAEGHVAVDGAKIVRHRAKATDLEIVLREGKNREIRRILARLGHKVMTLQRVALGPLRLGDLPRGAFRPLRPEELNRLREEVFYQSKAAATGTTEDPSLTGKAPKKSKRSAEKRASSGPRDVPASVDNARATRVAKVSGSPQVAGDKAPRKAKGSERLANSADRVPRGSERGTKKTGQRMAGGRLPLGTEGRVQQSVGAKQAERALRDSQRVGTVIGDDTEIEKEPKSTLPKLSRVKKVNKNSASKTPAAKKKAGKSERDTKTGKPPGKGANKGVTKKRGSRKGSSSDS